MYPCMKNPLPRARRIRTSLFGDAFLLLLAGSFIQRRMSSMQRSVRAETSFARCIKAHLSAVLLVVLAGCSRDQPVKTVWEIDDLSKGHYINIHSIVAVGDENFVLTGGNTPQDLTAWAARIDGGGRLLWEYLDGPKEAWTDFIQSNNNSFFGAVQLDGGRLLLCGVKVVGKKPTAFLVRLDGQGKRIDERQLVSREEEFPGSVKCIRWGNGIALLTGLSKSPRATGSLTKLDVNGNVLWERRGDPYSSSDAMQSSGGRLLLLTTDDSGMALVKLDEEGNVLARQQMPVGALGFVKSVGAASDDILVSNTGEEGSNLLRFDRDLRSLGNARSLDNIFVKSAFEFTDRSMVIFGNRRTYNPTATMWRIDKSGRIASYFFNALYLSRWGVDAAPTSNPNEFITTRHARGTLVLARVAIR